MYIIRDVAEKNNLVDYCFFHIRADPCVVYFVGSMVSQRPPRSVLRMPIAKAMIAVFFIPRKLNNTQITIAPSVDKG